MSTQGICNALATLENDLELSCKYHFSSLCPCYSVPQYLLKRKENLSSHTKHLIIFDTWKETKCLWIDEWITSCRHPYSATPQSNSWEARAGTCSQAMEAWSACCWVGGGRLQKATCCVILCNSEKAKLYLRETNQYLWGPFVAWRARGDFEEA